MFDLTDEIKSWSSSLNASFRINSIITLCVLLICSAASLGDSDNLLSIILLCSFNLWMKCFRNDIAFNNFIHDEKLFHTIIDFLASLAVKLSISELRSLWVDKVISGSSHIFPIYYRSDIFINFINIICLKKSQAI